MGFRRPVVVVLVAVAVLVGAAAAGYATVRSFGTHRTAAEQDADIPETDAVTLDAPTVAKKFLDAWAAGDTAEAGRWTDAPEEAAGALTEWAGGLQAKDVTITLGAGVAQPLPFDVTLTAGAAGRWHYASTVTVETGSRVVHWAPTVLHPDLDETSVLALGPVDPGKAALLDHAGAPLPAGKYPSLTGITAALAKKGGSAGKAGLAVQIADRSSGHPLKTLATLVKPGGGGGVQTTLDAAVQAAAEHATASRPKSGLVVLQPSTGSILAVANSPATGTDRALLARLAPGSTMKVITTAALLAAGVRPDQAVPCTDTITVNGKVFHNAEGIVSGNLSLTQDFAKSCNTAFIGMRDRLGDDTLTTLARGTFGLTEWDIGLGEQVAYGSVPVPGDEVTKAADMIGQGTVGMSPLAMASVAATVFTGRFTQPVLTPTAPQVTAGSTLPASTTAALRTMMRQVVTSGTARRTLGDLSGVAAKTGTAETSGPDNGWLLGYRGDLAFGCVVEGGGHGADSCGPLVHDLLTALG